MNFYYPFALVSLALALPAHAEQAVQELEYKSAFEGYQSYSDSEIQNWPDMIKRVQEIGGWRVYAREPYEEKNQDKVKNKEKTKPAASNDAATPKAHSHGGAQ
jgi:high-affinity Fe2+/Pb2+ permease